MNGERLILLGGVVTFAALAAGCSPDTQYGQIENWLINQPTTTLPQEIPPTPHRQTGPSETRLVTPPTPAPYATDDRPFFFQDQPPIDTLTTMTAPDGPIEQSNPVSDGTLPLSICGSGMAVAAIFAAAVRRTVKIAKHSV